MKKLILIPFLFILILPLSAETTALVPYSFSGKNEAAMEYTRMIYSFTKIFKGYTLISPEKSKRQLMLLGKKSTGTITAHDLDRLGGNMDSDYILIGRIRKKNSSYIVKSVLYSVHSSQIADSYTLRSNTLRGLAQKEVARVFFRKKNSIYSQGESNETILIMEAANGIKDIWQDLSKSVISFSQQTLDRAGNNNRIWLLPLSSKYGRKSLVISRKNSFAIQKRLSKMKPAGTVNSNSLSRGLTYLLGTREVRHSHNTKIIILSSHLKPPVHYSRIASLIRRYHISLTWIDFSGCSRKRDIRNFVNASHGEIRNAAFRQKVFDLQGRPQWIYLQNCRVFTSYDEVPSWNKGIIRIKGKYGRARKEFAEVSVSDTVNRTNFYHHFSRSSQIALLNKAPYSSNCGTLMNDSLKGLREESGRYRAFIKDISLSLWVSVNSDVARLLERAEGEIWLPAYIKRQKSATYGFTLSLLPIKMKGSLIPHSMRRTMKSLVKGAREKEELVFVRIKKVRLEKPDSDVDIRSMDEQD